MGDRGNKYEALMRLRVGLAAKRVAPRVYVRAALVLAEAADCPSCMGAGAEPVLASGLSALLAFSPDRTNAISGYGRMGNLPMLRPQLQAGRAAFSARPEVPSRCSSSAMTSASVTSRAASITKR